MKNIRLLESANPTSAGNLDRRAFLVETAALATGLALFDPVPAAAVMDEPAIRDADLMKLVVFLTNKTDLSTEIVIRAHRALIAEEPSFDRRLRSLIQRIDAAGLSDVEEFRTSPLARDSELMVTAIAVISALYTGRVGNSYRGHLVSFEEALMYRPTADVTVIPTYARAGPGYWVKAPLA
jgi:fructose 5-dehydrogenase small subunit